MFRYERNEPHLMHHGTKGMKWGERLYQYPDGSLTPLGREHYGYKSKADTRSGAERRVAKVEALADTAKGYAKGLIKGTWRNKTGGSNKAPSTDRAAKAREAKAEKKRIKEAEELQKKHEEQKRLEEEERERKRQQSSQEAKEIEDEIAKRESQSRVDQAKRNRWADFTNEDLERYAQRVNLEAKATEALIRKIDAPRQILEEITKYGKVGIDIYTQYKNITGMVNKSKEEKVPDLSEKLAKQTLEKFVKDVNGGKKVEDFKSKDLEDIISIIGKINKIEGMSKKGSNSNNNNGGNNNQKKKGS